MNDIERVAVLTAIQKRCRELIDEIRPAVNERAIEDYLESGITKRAVRVAGEKVADLIVPMSKASYVIDDPDAFRDFAESYGLGRYVTDIDPEKMADAVGWLAAEHPEVLRSEWRCPDWERAMTPCGDGATYLDSGMPVPGVRRVPPAPKTPTLRGVTFEGVASAVSKLPGGMAGLLDGGAE